MELAEASYLILPHRSRHFLRRLRHRVPTVRSLDHLRGLLLRGLLLPPDPLLAGLSTLRTHSRLIHRLERIVTWHASVVQILLLPVPAAALLLLADSAIIETPRAHRQSYLSLLNLFLLIRLLKY